MGKVAPMRQRRPVKEIKQETDNSYSWNYFDPPTLISMRERQDEYCMSETVLNRITEKDSLASPQVDYPTITRKRSLLWA
jgi:hypothetical protein